MLNYSHLIDRKPPRTDASPPRHPALPSNPVLVKSLPRTSEISKRAEQYAHSARKQHILNDALTSAVETPLDARPAPSADDKQLAASSDGAAGTAPATTRSGPGKRGGGPYEPFEVLRAIEKKDLAVILDVKSHQFDLLVTAGPGQPLPLVYAIRMGKSHADMAIVIVGAISRRVNDTSDDELAQKDPRTLATLRAIRANLKIAISASLSGPDGDTSLLSSFLQVIVMLEGNKFLQSSTSTLSLALRSPLASKPVATAQRLMLKWVSRELAARQVASVEEYVANAVGDLVLLGLWSIVQDQLARGQVDSIPLYYFARDDRIQKAVEERMSDLRRRKGSVTQLSKQVRSRLDVALDVLGRRSLNGRERVDRLRRVFDEGEKREAVVGSAAAAAAASESS
ncbi:hypothetical protein BMF94_1744 [Rhodotorula taiwanensis]|uniref:Uncharacterized protein n=1 Tax=Rhodotorula taiwanensis TaxID=741276 RepID=A0A2S5BEB9_9BASI|nr:hypothetical protein BMF94_1744 [Rhodotorula taiwanensis]